MLTVYDRPKTEKRSTITRIDASKESSGCSANVRSPFASTHKIKGSYLFLSLLTTTTVPISALLRYRPIASSCIPSKAFSLDIFSYPCVLEGEAQISESMIGKKLSQEIRTIHFYTFLLSKQKCSAYVFAKKYFLEPVSVPLFARCRVVSCS